MSCSGSLSHQESWRQVGVTQSPHGATVTVALDAIVASFMFLSMMTLMALLLGVEEIFGLRILQ